MKGLTPRQREVLTFIEDFIGNHRHSPSFREIQKHFGFTSLASVHTHIQVLKRKGYLESEAHASRSIALTEESQQPLPGPNSIDLALMGQFFPGETIEMFPQTSTLSVPRQMVHDTESTYLVRLKGDTLKSEQLQNGDLLLVEARDEAESGEVAMLSDDAGHVLLKRHDGESTLPIQGVVVGLIRVY